MRTRERERELRIPRVGTAFDSNDRAVDCQLKQLHGCAWFEPSKGRRKEVNKDFEHFELGPKEEKQEKQWKMSVSHLVRALLRRGESVQAHRTSEAVLHLEAAAL